MEAVMETYKRMNISPVSGRGAWIFDAEGRQYLDFIGGIATNSLGHGHPALVESVQKQAQEMIHCSNLFQIPLQQEVARTLTSNTDFDRAFFCNSGTEAVEGAIKLARKHAATEYDPHKRQIVSFTHSFHGRTYGGLSATAQPKLHEGFGPMLEEFIYVPYGDEAAAAQAIGENTAAVIVEPIQGEGGVNIPPEGFLAGLRRLCDEHGALLIFDEVQTGAGRTGYLYAYQGMGVVPDVLTSAKGLGGGVPVGAVLSKEECAALGAGDHGSTFGGNPLAMAATKAVLGVVLEPGFLEEVRMKGTILKNALGTLAQKLPQAGVRGEGLLIGLELGEELAPKVFEKCLERGLVVNVVGEDTLRLAPPLTVSRAEIRHALDILRGAVEEVSGVPFRHAVA